MSGEALLVKPRGETREHIAQRVADLAARFSECLAQFQRGEAFPGPSLYFHLRTISRLQSHRDANGVLEDEQYFEYLYATLTSWGLHRMGPGNAKLMDFSVFMESARELFKRVSGFFGRSILSLDDHEVGEAAAVIGDAIGRQTGLTKAESVLVANSKAVHHFLPDLVPPIDRAHTLMFFFQRKNPPGSAKETFEIVFPHFVKIGKSTSRLIREAVAKCASAQGPTGWNSGHAKVMDNALIGWVRLHRSQREQ